MRTSVALNVALHTRDTVSQLSDFNAQADTLSALQARLRISFFQKGLHSAGTLFQIDHPPLVGLIEGNIDINAAFSDDRIYRNAGTREQSRYVPAEYFIRQVFASVLLQAP
jgi:hypothetical protein